MNDLRAAIIGKVREAVPEGVPVQEERSDTVIAPFVWLRPPDVSRGNVRAQRQRKAATLVIDVWTYEIQQLHSVLAALVFLDGHHVMRFGDALDILYSLESSTFVDEPDTYRRSLLYSVTFDDVRMIA